MRDDGRSWADIRKVYEETTGEPIGQSTLPNRYSRLKANFTVIKEEDSARMIESKHEVESAFEKEKWNLIAESVSEKGGEKYKVNLRIVLTLVVELGVRC